MNKKPTMKYARQAVQLCGSIFLIIYCEMINNTNTRISVLFIICDAICYLTAITAEFPFVVEMSSFPGCNDELASDRYEEDEEEEDEGYKVEE